MFFSFMDYDFSMRNCISEIFAHLRIQRLSPMISSTNFTVSGFTFLSVICLVLTLDIGSVDQSLLFAYGYPFIPALFVQKTTFIELPLYFVKNQYSICMWLFLDHLFFPIDLFIFMPYEMAFIIITSK